MDLHVIFPKLPLFGAKEKHTSNITLPIMILILYILRCRRIFSCGTTCTLRITIKIFRKNIKQTYFWSFQSFFRNLKVTFCNKNIIMKGLGNVAMLQCSSICCICICIKIFCSLIFLKQKY